MDSQFPSSTNHKFSRIFDVRGISYDNEKRIIFMCRFYGEPFWVIPEEVSEVRKKWWTHSQDKILGGKVKTFYNEQSKQGVPQGIVTGTLVEMNKKYDQKNSNESANRIVSRSNK